MFCHTKSWRSIAYRTRVIDGLKNFIITMSLQSPQVTLSHYAQPYKICSRYNYHESYREDWGTMDLGLQWTLDYNGPPSIIHIIFVFEYFIFWHINDSTTAVN